MDKLETIFRKDYDILILDTLMSIDPYVRKRINEGMKEIIDKCSDMRGEEFKKCVWAEIEKSKLKIREGLSRHD